MSLENVFTGILLLLVLASLIWLSRIYYKKERYNLAAFLLVLISLGLGLFIAATPHLQPWDERYHALVAKNLTKHPLLPTLYENPLLSYDYKQWAGNHIWVHKQPVTLWGLALSIKLIGAKVLAVRLPSVLMAAAGTYFTYLIGKRLFNPRVGLFAAFFFSINGLILELVGARMATDHVDVFFMFFVTLAVLCAVYFAQTRKFWWNLLCGLFVGMAILCKWLPALIVLPIWLALVLHYKRKFKQFFFHGVALVVVIVAVALPWQLYIYSSFPLEAAWESKYNVMHLQQDLENTGKPFYYYADIMRVSYGELIYVPFIWLIVKAVRKRIDGRYWALLAWIVIPFLFFSFSATKLQGYVLFCSVALFITAALFIDALLKGEVNIKWKWLRYAVLILLFALPLRYSLERLKPFGGFPTVPQWQTDIHNFAEKNGENDKVVIFNTDTPIEYMYHTEATAYIGMPDPSLMDSLESVGFEVHVVREGNRPERWK